MVAARKSALFIQFPICVVLLEVRGARMCFDIVLMMRMMMTMLMAITIRMTMMMMMMMMMMRMRMTMTDAVLMTSS